MATDRVFQVNFEWLKHSVAKASDEHRLIRLTELNTQHMDTLKRGQACPWRGREAGMRRSAKRPLEPAFNRGQY